MKTVNGERYLKLGEVAKLLERSTQTIILWYKYQDDKGEDVGLPPVRTDLDKRGSRYWKEEDIAALVDFRDGITRGSMSDFNVKLWGKRGEEILERGTQYGAGRENSQENHA
jgi:hypothetical protein